MTVHWDSHHFNLHHRNSDYDRFVFTAPTVQDINERRYYEHFHQEVRDGVVFDYSVRDIKLFHLYLPQMNFTNMLFAPIETNDSTVKKLIEIRKDIAIMDLPTMYREAMDKVEFDLERLDRGKPNLIQAFGYDTRHAHHAWRTVDALERFYHSGFGDMHYAMTYDDSDVNREILLDIKLGKYPRELVVALIRRKLRALRHNGVERAYLNAPVLKHIQEEVTQHIHDIIKRHVS